MVYFTGGRNMGTFHIIDGAYVTIHSSGIKRTCARCHQSSINCVGGSFAKQCEENGGPKIKLVDHMRVLWQSVGFVPDDLKFEETEDQNEEVLVSDNNFTPPQRPKTTPNESTQFTGVSVKNFPKDVPENAILAFLESKGLPKGCQNLKFQKKKKKY